jgi:hypothetical protein
MRRRAIPAAKSHFSLHPSSLGLKGLRAFRYFLETEMARPVVLSLEALVRRGRMHATRQPPGIPRQWIT